MKIFTLLFFGLLVCSTQILHAQSFKYPLFEHFTQASCGPCADQNPGFQTTILDAHPNDVRHIAYHTSWPGVDPMYNFNEQESNDRVDFYGVSGVPDIFLMGNFKEAQPGSFTELDVEFLQAQTSPVRIVVADEDGGSYHDVSVTVTSIGTPPAGSYVLRTAIIERNVDYINPPGNNGETYFPNVFRDMLPGSDGDAITLPAQGSSITFSYTYLEDAVWDMNEIGLVSWVQETGTKEILNCGATFDEVVNASLTPAIPATQTTDLGSTSSFNVATGNLNSSGEDFTYTLTTDAPVDWSATFDVNGNTYTSTADVSWPGGTTSNVVINVTPGTTPYYAGYTLTMQSTTNPAAPAILTKVYVVSGVTDLLVNNTASNGITVGDASAWQDVYIEGLNFAGSTSFTATDNLRVSQGLKENALTDIDNIYYNVGWTFPGITDEFADLLEQFMDGGGNLFMAGQDIAWETWDPVSQFATANKQSFFTNYLHAGYVADGDAANNPLTANMNDIYLDVPSASLFAYYGNTYFYPEQLSVGNNAIPIFYYNNNTGKVAGVRHTNGNYKSVYLGVGLEMVTEPTDRNNIMKTTYDWFHGVITSAEFDQQTQPVIGSFPNPADDVAYITVTGMQNDFTFILTDVLGRIIHSIEQEKSTSMIQIDTEKLPQGIYFYHIADGSACSIAKALQVTH